MFKNYLKIALRNLLRYKVYSFINIFGLAIGMACFLLIVFYIQFERSYDDFHENSKNIYKLVRVNTLGERVERRVNTGAPLAPLLTQNFPAIKHAVRFTWFQMGLIGYGDKRFIERRFFFADDAVFKVFTFPLLKGDPDTALKEPFSVILTEETAQKYFGEEDPLNKILVYNFYGNKFDFKVTGVAASIPRNSHLDFDFLASYSSLRPIVGEHFLTKHWDSPTHTYILLSEGYDPKDLESQLPAFTEKHVDKWSFTSISHELMPLKDLYFKSPGPAIGRSGNPQFLFVLSVISVFILLIACINFMNLSTSRSGSRAKEIGMRKVIGAQRPQLVRQFIGESLVCSFLALFLAAFLVEIFLPAFSHFVGEELHINYLADFKYLITMLLTAILVGIVSGSYPALFLSSFRPAPVLKKEFRGGGAAVLVRKALVVGQFAMSIVLIAGSILIMKQMNFVKNRDMGFNKNHLITMPIRERAVRNRLDFLKDRWLQSPDVLGVTATSMLPAVESPNGINISARGIDDLGVPIIYVDHDYVKTLEVTLTRGRDFSRGIATDATDSLLLNEAALERFGWQDGLGEQVEMYFKREGKKDPQYLTRVIGILPNFNFRDLTVSLQPMLFKIDTAHFRHILIRINGNRIPESIDYVKKVWQEFQFDYPFEFSFLEDEMNNVYRSFRNFSSITRYGTFWAILIACLGLFGLASFTVEKRTKEIGIRKVLGASISRIIRLINMEFFLLVALANIIAWPVAYYAMIRYLRYFAYRTSIGIWIFLLAGALALLVAVLTVSYQASKAALANPIDSLRYE
jgi:putative ABC transport system permease protein